MTNYIDPVSYLPQNMGEIYSDRNIRMVGYAKVPLSNANQIVTLNVKIICTPLGGGAEAVTNIPSTTYTLLGEGSSLWVKINRDGTTPVTNTPVVNAAGTQPRPSKDYVQIFYQHSLGMMGFGNQYITQSDTFTNIGTGFGQKTFDAIVSNDSTGNYTDLWLAISDLSAISGARILVRSDQIISSATTISNSNLYIEFSEGVKLTSALAAGTALTFSGNGTSTNGLTLRLNGSGASGLSFTGTKQQHTNVTVDIAGSCPTVFSFGAASGYNNLDGRLYLSGGTYTTSVLDSSNLKTNSYSFSTPVDIQTSLARPFIRTSAMTMAANDYIYADTTGGTPGSPAFILTLPVSAALGDRIWVVDYKFNFAISGVTIARNGHNIKGIADNYLCNISGKIYTIAYVDASWGWTIN